MPEDQPTQCRAMAEDLPSVLRGLDPAVPSDADIDMFVRHARCPGLPTWIARRALRPFCSDFALNGLFGTYPLYLLESSHWRALLGNAAGGRLLDIGAAAGDVTSELAPLFDQVVATDVSRPMVQRLRQRGFIAHRTDLTTADLPGPQFDTVTLLNVLDRCDDPGALLAAAVRLCRPEGTVVVASPLPYDPWRYAGSVPLRPKYPLPLRGQFFDADLGSLVDVILPLAGLEPVRWIRTPYVSAGDRRRAEYRLDATVIVARKLPVLDSQR